MKLLRNSLTIILPLCLFLFIAISVVNQTTTGFDSYVYSNVSRLISPKMTYAMIIVSFLGSGQFLAIVSIVLLVLLLYKREKYSFLTAILVINLILSALLNTGLKYLIHRNRPNILRLIEIGGLSFPSGHSMVSMSFYGFVIYIVFLNLKTKFKHIIIGFLALIILLIGFSRIYLGVHYASDVIGGFTLGVFWIGLYSKIVSRYRKNLQKD